MKLGWAAALIASVALAQTAADPDLAAAIAKIKAIDNHAHPLRYVAAGEKPDDEFDALPCDTLEANGANPVRLRPDNPELIAAWRTLYGVEKATELPAAKRRVMTDKGAAYPAWVLDQIGTETMMANRIALGAGLTPPRFRWVPFVDALMLPLRNGVFQRMNPDYKVFYAAEDRLLQRYFAESALQAAPPTLDAFTRLIAGTLERQKRLGAVAVKFEAAYLRPLDFPEVAEAEARRIYARYIKALEPPADEYLKLQNFLFRYIARESGRLGLPVQIHVALGCGDYFQVGNANPLLLESVINDPALRKTNFILVHGGWPATAQMASLLSKPNVWTDVSFLALTLSPRALSEMMRRWLELYPEKVLFGTDAFVASPEVGWEETAWIGAAAVRQALALALSGMMQDGEITRPRALELAQKVLRENALQLYRFQ
jgi:predicted TIM-barrel fold metal-dependent hydrolase